MSRRRTLSLIAGLATTGCVIGPYDMGEIRSTSASTTFTGYTTTPSTEVRVEALDQSTQQWIVVARATSTTTPTVPAGTWNGNPDLYRWGVSAPIATPADPAGNCFTSPTCLPPSGEYNVATVRLRFEQGSASDPLRLMVYDELWQACMDQQTLRGIDFVTAAFDCRGPAWPEMRLRRLEEWWRLPALTSPSAPAIAGTPGLLSIVASDGGRLVVSSSPSIGAFLNWVALDGQPAGGVSSDGPIVVNEQGGFQTRALVRGNDGRVYQASLSSAQGWSDLAPVAGTSGATGRLSAALVVDTPTDRLHLLYAVAGGLMVYRQYLDNVQVTSATFAATDGTLGAGVDRVSIALRTTNGLELWSMTQAGSWVPQALTTYATGGVEDLSEVVSFGNVHHLLVARRPKGGSPEILDLALPRTPQAVTTSSVAGYSGGPVKLALAVARDHLVATWRDGTAGLQAARMDSADSARPWIRAPQPIGATVTLASRPALAAMNMRPNVPGPLYAQPAYGDDLYAVALGSDGRVRLTNLSRGIMRREVARHFDLFDLATPAGCSVSPDVADAVWVEDLMANDRPIVSELGAVWWMLPGWLTDEVFRRAGQEMCEAGGAQPAAAYRACELAKTPLVLKPVGEAYVCPDGAYVNQDSDQFKVFEELGHVMAQTIGLRDDGSPPEPRHADVSDIPLADLQLGVTLFGASLGPCGDQSRCPGFVGVGGNYDTTSLQHSFIYALLWYVLQGDILRSMITTDLARSPCNDLLARKYLWLRRVVFRGVDLDATHQPRLVPALISTCF